MRFKVRKGKESGAGTPVILHCVDCERLGIRDVDRVSIPGKGNAAMSVCSSSTVLGPGEVILSPDAITRLNLKEGQDLELCIFPRPASWSHIHKTLDGQQVDEEGIKTIVDDIMRSRVSREELAAWLTAIHINGLTDDEVLYLAKAMASSVPQMEFDRSPVFDFHSVGGVPGNKVTPIVVSIVASAGLLMPKTSSRAISSACGTIDFVEVFCDVNLPPERLKEIASSTGGVFASGSSVHLTPVNTALVDVQYPLGIDPRPLMTASILSKKLVMGADFLVMDLPMGPGTKIVDMKDAEAFAKGFMDVGHKLGIRVGCAVTSAEQPLGRAIGPALEAKECIEVLEGNGPPDVREKACELAGMVLEMAGLGPGAERARGIIESGDALRKFREIAHAQGGASDISSASIKVGEHTRDVVAGKSGYVLRTDNAALTAIARSAGSPLDKGAGIILEAKNGMRVERGDVLFRIHADHEGKADRAKTLAMKLQPMHIEGMLMSKVPVIRVGRRGDDL